MTALALQDHEVRPLPTLLRPIAKPNEVLSAQEAARELIAKALTPERDYGLIPGTQKPTLLKPGAERVALAFGCYYGQPEIIEREVDHDRLIQWSKRSGKSGESRGLYRYVVRVTVFNRANGEAVGSGIGMCSTMESKYVESPRESENTILKMAHKRAIVSAALATFGLSDQFTQDVEDGADTPVSNGHTQPAATAPNVGNGIVVPFCPKCEGPMWDNRASKTNPRAPDFKCKDKGCDGAKWLTPKEGKQPGNAVRGSKRSSTASGPGLDESPPLNEVEAGWLGDLPGA